MSGYETLKDRRRGVGLTGEESGVDILDYHDRAPHQTSAGGGYSQEPCPGVCRIDGAVDQTLCLKLAYHLRGHLHVRASLARELQLVRRASLILEPPRARKQHKLDVRQLQRRERSSDGPLPRVRDMPQKEPGAGRGTIREPAPRRWLDLSGRHTRPAL